MWTPQQCQRNQPGLMLEDFWDLTCNGLSEWQNHIRLGCPSIIERGLFCKRTKFSL